MSRFGSVRFTLVRFGIGLLVAACAYAPEEATTPGTGDDWIRSTLDSLDLEQRVAQMFGISTSGRLLKDDPAEWPRVVSLVSELGVGGIIFFQGDPLEQATLVNQLQREAKVPLLVSQDMEWGAGMRLDGASRYPVAMAIAATGDPELAYRAGYGTALEAQALGVGQIFAPVADVNGNPRNPVIGTRAFSDDPHVTAEFVAAFVRGAQDGGILATVKHFPGHGGTSTDSHETLPVVRLSRARLDSVDLVPFREAFRAGVASVMTAHIAYTGLGDPEDLPATLSPGLATRLLRESLGFEGLVVTDALNMEGVVQTGTPGEIAVRAVLAGADMLLMSTDVIAAHAAVVSAVRDGRITESRIEASVRRILAAKLAIRLPDRTELDLVHVRRTIHDGRQQALEQIIAERALTLVSGTLPFVSDRPGGRVLVVVVTDRDEQPETVFASRLRRDLPGVQIDVERIHSRSTPAMREAIPRRAAGYSTVVVASFVSAATWWQRPGIAGGFRRVIEEIAALDRPGGLVVFGTPYLAADLDPGPASVLLAWDRSDAMQTAAAQAIVGAVTVSGRLPISLSRTHALGTGLTSAASRPRETTPEAVGLDSQTLGLADSLILAAIGKRAFPGAALVIGRDGAVVRARGFGTFTYESKREVTTSSPFDLASVTKVVATTTALMLLYDQGRICLDDPVMKYVPEFGRNGKEQVTLRHLLTHTGGLIPFRAFHRLGITTRSALLEAIFDEELQYKPGTDSRYSDFGPIMLALVVERVTGVPFDHFVTGSIFEPLGMWNTGFRRTGRPDDAVVPTERDDYFRNRLLQGEVHDETAWILGGTAGHAGLFSTVDDLARFVSMMVNEGRVADRVFIRPETVRLFTTRADTTAERTRALGWDTRPPEGPSSAGALFGPRSYGHTGFTGTSLWIDPDAGVFVILLTNRVYPSRSNQRHVPVRSALADLVHGSIRSASPLLPGDP